LKDLLHGQTFESDETVLKAKNDWFEQLDEEFFIDGIKALGRHWGKMHCA